MKRLLIFFVLVLFSYSAFASVLISSSSNSSQILIINNATFIYNDTVYISNGTQVNNSFYYNQTINTTINQTIYYNQTINQTLITNNSFYYNQTINNTINQTINTTINNTIYMYNLTGHNTTNELYNVFISDGNTAWDNLYGFITNTTTWLQNFYSRTDIENMQYLNTTEGDGRYIQAETDPEFTSEEPMLARTGVCPDGQFVNETTTAGAICSEITFSYNVDVNLTATNLELNKTNNTMNILTTNNNTQAGQILAINNSLNATILNLNNTNNTVNTFTTQIANRPINMTCPSGQFMNSTSTCNGVTATGDGTGGWTNTTTQTISNNLNVNISAKNITDVNTVYFSNSTGGLTNVKLYADNTYLYVGVISGSSMSSTGFYAGSTGLRADSNGDIWTTGATGDLWLGNSTQANALFRAYATGQAFAKNVSASDEMWSNGSKVCTSANGICGSSTATLNLSDYNVTIRKSGNPTTITTQNDYNDLFNSAGIITDCNVTENPDGTINVSSGEATIRTSASNLGDLVSIVIPARDNITLSNGRNWIYYDYNGSYPFITTSTDINSFNCLDKCVIATIGKNGTRLWTVNQQQQSMNFPAVARRKSYEISKINTGLIELDSGTYVLSNIGTNITVSSGSSWLAYHKTTSSAFDTSVAGTGQQNIFTYFYRDGGTGWKEVFNSKTLDGANYDDGTGTLHALTVLHYGVHWVYAVIDSTNTTIAVVYGQNDYATLNDAEASQQPSSLPYPIQGTGVLLGRYVVTQAGAVSQTDRWETTTFESSPVSNHNSLGGLQGGKAGEYYHLNLTDYASVNTMQSQIDVLKSENTTRKNEIISINSSANIRGFGFNTTTELNNLYLSLTSQTWNYTAWLNGIGNWTLDKSSYTLATTTTAVNQSRAIQYSCGISSLSQNATNLSSQCVSYSAWDTNAADDITTSSTWTGGDLSGTGLAPSVTWANGINDLTLTAFNITGSFASWENDTKLNIRNITIDTNLNLNANNVTNITTMQMQTSPLCTITSNSTAMIMACNNTKVVLYVS